MGADTVVSLNPSDTRDCVGHYAMADANQMREAVAAARSARPAWSVTTTQVRADLLAEVATGTGCTQR